MHIIAWSMMLAQISPVYIIHSSMIVCDIPGTYSNIHDAKFYIDNISDFYSNLADFMAMAMLLYSSIAAPLHHYSAYHIIQQQQYSSTPAG